MLTRRHFIATGSALFSAAIAGPTVAASAAQEAKWSDWDQVVTPPDYDLWTSNPWGFNPRFLPHLVETKPGLKQGDIHVDAVARYIYHIRENRTAMRYGVAIAKGNLYEPGTYTIRRKVRWPGWTPTKSMIARDPETYGPLAGGMPPGPDNPLGSRALYLYVGNRDTYLRIHGTPFPLSIGNRSSSGCVRMTMPHINDLYDHVETGVKAYLYPPEDIVTAAG